jgi:hypothetical protein
MTPGSFTPHHTESPRGGGGEDSGWETTCTQILFGINAHTNRIDELLERVSHHEQVVAALSAERNEASAEARVAQAQAQAQAQQLAACEGRVSELLAVQQQQQLAIQQQLHQQQQQHSKDAAEMAAHVRAQQTAAVQQAALQEQVRMLVGRLASLEGHRVSERLGEVERGLDERAKASEAALRRGLAELAPTSENVRESLRGAKVAEEAVGVAHRCEAQMGMLREEAAGWHRRLSQVEAECCRSLTAVDGLRDRLVVGEERARSGSQAAVQAAAVHVKTLGSDLMQELQGKAAAADARRLGEQLHTLEGRHRSLEAEVEGVRGSRSEAASREAREVAAREAAAQACAAAEAVALREAELLRKELQRGLAQQQQQLQRQQQQLEQQLLQQLQRQQQQLEQQQQRPQSPAAALAALSNPSSPRPSSVSSPKWALGRAAAAAAAGAHGGGGGGDGGGDSGNGSRGGDTSGTRSLGEIEEQVEQLQQHLSSLPGLLQPLWSELQLGRWLWTSNMLKGTSKTAHGASAGCVPWNAERLNTCPEGFLWAHDRPFIQVHLSHWPRPRLGLSPTPIPPPHRTPTPKPHPEQVLNPGLYCISCSVFSGSCPTLAVEVNGVVVLRRVGSSRRITDAASQIAGTSLRDFLSLPAGGCRVSIRLESYGLGPANSQGFLELRKL